MTSWAPTHQEVHGVIPARAEPEGFSDTSRPSVADVMSVVGQIVSEVVAEVGAFDPATTISDPADTETPVTLGSMARWAATLGAAATLEAGFFPEQQQLGDTSVSTILYARYTAALARLKATIAGLTAAAADPAPRYVTGTMATALPSARHRRSVC